jgi:hypothetical protein
MPGFLGIASGVMTLTKAAVRTGLLISVSGLDSQTQRRLELGACWAALPCPIEGVGEAQQR